MHLDVAARTDAALYMDNLSVLKAADNVNNRVYFADIGEKFISQTFTLGSALYKTCDVHKFDDGRGNLFRVVHLCQCIQTVVGNSNGADVWFDGAEGVVGRLCACVGDCIKKCALADVRQTHDTKFHIDSFLSISEKSRYTFIISFVDSLGKSCAVKIEDGDFIGLAKSV